MSVDLNSESGLHPTKPRLLFERTFSSFSADNGIWGHTWAVFPDGKRFLFVENPIQLEVRELRVVLNWFEELKARVPRNNAPLAEQLAGGARMWWASLRLS